MIPPIPVQSLIPPIPVQSLIPPSEWNISRSRLPILVLHPAFKISRIPHPTLIVSLIPHPAKPMLDPLHKDRIKTSPVCN